MYRRKLLFADENFFQLGTKRKETSIAVKNVRSWFTADKIQNCSKLKLLVTKNRPDLHCNYLGVYLDAKLGLKTC